MRQTRFHFLYLPVLQPDVVGRSLRASQPCCPTCKTPISPVVLASDVSRTLAACDAANFVRWADPWVRERVEHSTKRAEDPR